MSNEFMRKLMTMMSYADDDQEQNTLAMKTRFYNFQTLNSDILNTFVLATAKDLKMPTTMETLPASSSIVFEMFADGTIKGYLNDEEYTLGGCEPGQPCKRSDFEPYVQGGVKKISGSVSDYCKQTDDIMLLN